jgi:hypothetical protein
LKSPNWKQSKPSQTGRGATPALKGWPSRISAQTSLFTNKSVDLSDFSSMFLSMTYTILEGNGTSAEVFKTENTENAWFEALNYLGYKIKYDSSIAEDEVKEYSLFDSDGDLILRFFETFVENACVYALTDLGYSVEEGDLLADKIVQVSF